MPHVFAAAKQTSDDPPYHVFVAAHGIFNGEFMGALLRRRVQGEGSGWSRAGMTSTSPIEDDPNPRNGADLITLRATDVLAWRARMVLQTLAGIASPWRSQCVHLLILFGLLPASSRLLTSFSHSWLILQDPIHPHPTPHTEPTPVYTNQSSIPSADAPTKPIENASRPKLDIEILVTNQSSHLDGLVRVEEKEGAGGEMTDEERKMKEALAGGGGGGGKL
jgi:hypothetical protein